VVFRAPGLELHGPLGRGDRRVAALERRFDLGPQPLRLGIRGVRPDARPDDRARGLEASALDERARVIRGATRRRREQRGERDQRAKTANRACVGVAE
jgi:hypothetical protein